MKLLKFSPSAIQTKIWDWRMYVRETNRLVSVCDEIFSIADKIKAMIVKGTNPTDWDVEIAITAIIEKLINASVLLDVLRLMKPEQFVKHLVVYLTALIKVFLPIKGKLSLYEHSKIRYFDLVKQIIDECETPKTPEEKMIWIETYRIDDFLKLVMRQREDYERNYISPVNHVSVTKAIPYGKAPVVDMALAIAPEPFPKVLKNNGESVVGYIRNDRLSLESARKGSRVEPKAPHIS